MGKSGKRKKKKKDRDRKVIRSLDARVAKRMTEALPHGVRGKRPEGYARTSDTLEAFIRPWLNQVSDETPLDVVRSILMLGIIAWNSVLVEGSLSAAVDYLRSQLASGPGQPPEALIIAQEMCQRKLDLFPDDDRIFIEADVARLPSGDLRLSAAASFTKA